MTTQYEKRKNYFKKWRELNHDKYNEYSKSYMRSKYVPKLMYSYDYQCRQFMAIRIF